MGAEGKQGREKAGIADGVRRDRQRQMSLSLRLPADIYISSSAGVRGHNADFPRIRLINIFPVAGPVDAWHASDAKIGTAAVASRLPWEVGRALLLVGTPGR